MGQGARPAHPDHRRFGMIAELLRYPFGAACAAERPDGRGDGLLDLVGAGFIRALQRRHKQSVGSERADADGVIGWPHGVPLLRVLLIGGCVPVIVIWRGPRSRPPGVQATGQWWPGTRRATSQPARANAAPPVVEQVRTGQLGTKPGLAKVEPMTRRERASFHADAGPAEPVDRLAVAAVSVLALTQQRSGTRFDAERPFGLAVICPRRELLEGAGRALGLPAPDSRQDQVAEAPVREPRIVMVTRPVPPTFILHNSRPDLAERRSSRRPYAWLEASSPP